MKTKNPPLKSVYTQPLDPPPQIKTKFLHTYKIRYRLKTNERQLLVHVHSNSIVDAIKQVSGKPNFKCVDSCIRIL